MTQPLPSAVAAVASSVHCRGVDRVEVARYYLRCEFPNLLGDSAAVADVLASAFDATVDALPEERVWRLLEALSFRLRLNPVFTAISDPALDWYDVDLPLDSIVLTGVAPAVDDVVYLPPVDRNPTRFAAYLRAYFDRHGDDDPAGLNVFRPSCRPVRLATLLLEERQGRPAILDGTHRLLEFALGGEVTVRALYGVRTGRPRQPRAGDSAFFQLRDLYLRHHRDPDAASAILATTRLLAVGSDDGVDAVATYWVDHPRYEPLKEVGARLLADIEAARRLPLPEGEPDRADQPVR